MSTCLALIIPADHLQPTRAEIINTDLETLQEIVSGSIENVTGDEWHFYLNEDGKELGLEPNIRVGALVVQLTGALTDTYRGDIVFLGQTSDGHDADAPAAWEQFLGALRI